MLLTRGWGLEAAGSMWDLYDDDESFQRLARGRGFHDAALLARVLYGKQARLQQEAGLAAGKVREAAAGNKKLSVQFRREAGLLTLDATILREDEKEADFDYLWRTRDYSFQPVKDFRSPESEAAAAVRTDVVLYDRKMSSEFDPEQEGLKDDMVAWEERFRRRQLELEQGSSNNKL